MKLIRKPLLSAVSMLGSALRLEHLTDSTGYKLILPFYHLATDAQPPHIRHLYIPKNIRAFEAETDYLLKHYNPLDLSDLYDVIKNGKTVEKPSFFLSFDDGLSEFHDIVAPILYRKGIPCACFLNSAFTDNKDLFYRYKVSLLIDFFSNNPSVVSNIISNEVVSKLNGKTLTQKLLSINYLNRYILDTVAVESGIDFGHYLKNNKPYMNSDQILSLIAKGFYFGAHSIDHPRYSLLTEDDQLVQTITSIQWVRNKFNLPYSIFAFPFTDDGVHTSFFRALDNVSNQNLITFGTSGLKSDPVHNHFQRLSMKSNGYDTETHIKTEYIYYILKSWLNKNIIKRHD
jgi:peptidoglycan/xylan/chitin deacetylase (PgdA/CDA1 family)